MDKSLDQAFVDWEGSVFGYGYGTGEEHVIKALHKFFELTPPPEAFNRCYSYVLFERDLGGATAWLLINALCNADIIEYGSSPRFAWLTDHGYRLRSYILSSTVSELEDILGNGESECGESYCNCGDSGKGCEHNPFFSKYKAG